MRWSFVVLLGVTACASAKPKPSDLLTRRCERNVQADARCVDLLTGADGEYESRAQVMAAEKRREQSACDKRLAALRARALSLSLSLSLARSLSLSLSL